MIAFQIFGLSIYWYGIFYFISFLLGYYFLSFVGKKTYFKAFPALQQVLTQHLETLMMFLLLGVLIGGRLGHVFIYDWGSFVGNWWAIFAVWNGGMSFIGGIVGVLLALVVFRFFFQLSRKEFVLLLDCVLVIVPVGIFLGRLGNFLNQELYGISVQINGFSQFIRPDFVINLLRKIGLLHIYPNVDGNLRVNTNLLSMLFEGITLFVLHSVLFRKMIKRQLFQMGKITSWFMIGYSGFRFLFEYLREDSQAEFVGFFTKSQRVFLVIFICGIVLFVVSQKGNGIGQKKLCCEREDISSVQ
ncbi:MAG: prolipoprotein diacylglyceryl transferase [Candidatus Peribacteria bacterium]|jgi:phosphatidylglycerol:prolipoprotein diacylglycerol transferase|nr:prolipoprotein diacylglyceryl transferase [Candidatus Peribacteria bacterium]